MKKYLGFPGEKLMILSGKMIDQLKENPLSAALYLTDIGYFPVAKDHDLMREKGCENHIMILCVAGQGQVEMLGHSYQLGPNQICIIPKEIAHRYWADPLDPWSIYWCHYNGTLATAYTDYLSDKGWVLEIALEQREKIVETLRKIYQLVSQGLTKDKSIKVTNMMGLMMSLLKEDWQNNEGSSRLDQCLAYMLGHLEEKVTLEQLSDLTGLSKNHLIVVFKEQTGFSPIQYMSLLRIQKACHLLDTTDDSIGGIAAQVGYEDPLYFTKVFKKIMGQAPKYYRQLKKG